MLNAGVLRPFISFQLPVRSFSFIQGISLAKSLKVPSSPPCARANSAADTFPRKTPGLHTSPILGSHSPVALPNFRVSGAEKGDAAARRTLTMSSRIINAGQRRKMLSSFPRRNKPRGGGQFGVESAGLQPRANQTGGMEVEVLPILRYHNGVDQVIVVSRYCRNQERNIISLPSGSTLPGEEGWESAWRLTESITGLDSSTFSRGLLSTPLSSSGRGRLETVDIDAGRAIDSLGEKQLIFSPLPGQDIHGIPLQGLRDTLLKFKDEGRAVDRRLSYLAEGMELRYSRDHQTLYADGTGRAIGLLWMGISCGYAMSVICGGLGIGTGLKVEVTRSGQMPANWVDPGCD